MEPAIETNLQELYALVGAVIETVDHLDGAVERAYAGALGDDDEHERPIRPSNGDDAEPWDEARDRVHAARRSLTRVFDVIEAVQGARILRDR